MFHPLGSKPPSVYWRRRVALLTSVVIVFALIALILRVLFSTGGSPTAASPPRSPTRTSAAPHIPKPAPSTRSTRPRVSRTRTATRTPTPSPPPPPRCQGSQLKIAAVSNKSRYSVGAQPTLMLEVTNTGSAPCVQDLADRQIVLRVYNGESRVWGSHDCKVLPGTSDRTLAPHAPVRISVVWSGTSSRPGCAGIRQRVGAGTYTLYATLSGKDGVAAQFSIS